jgi:hypothetical protein
MQGPPDPLGKDPFRRDLVLLDLPSWRDWPRDVVLPSEHFCLLVAGDALGVDRETLTAFAGQALSAGCVYACAWGPGCRQVEFAFDVECARLEIADVSVVFTTSHADDGLEEALSYLIDIAFPSDTWAPTCRTSVVAVIDSDNWAAEVRRLVQGSIAERRD